MSTFAWMILVLGIFVGIVIDRAVQFVIGRRKRPVI